MKIQEIITPDTYAVEVFEERDEEEHQGTKTRSMIRKNKEGKIKKQMKGIKTRRQIKALEEVIKK